jgi:hypothetical protein
MTITLRLFLLLALVGLIAACNLANTPQPPAPIVNETTEVAPPDTSNTFITIYTDTVIGFAFNYPDGWTAQGEQGGFAMLYSYQPNPNDGGEGIAEGKSKMDFILLPAGTTLDSAVSDQKRQQEPAVEPTVIEREERITLLSGVQAVRLQVNSTRIGETPVLFADINGRVLMIVGYGDSSLFDAIVGTLRRVAT